MNYIYAGNKVRIKLRKKNMILKKNRKLRAEAIQSDKDAFAALGKVSNYKPASEDLTLDNLSRVKAEADSMHTARVQTRNAYRSADDDAREKEIEFHNLMTRVKKNMLAQFGEDSNEAQALGLKKQSEHRITGHRKNESVSES